MSISVQAVARQLAIPPEDLQRQAILAFLRDRTLFYNAERLRLCSKYGVSSLQEMDGLISGAKWTKRLSFRTFSGWTFSRRNCASWKDSRRRFDRGRPRGSPMAMFTHQAILD